MKTALLIVALLFTANAYADCGGYDCYDLLHVTYEEYMQKHSSPAAQVDCSGLDCLKYDLMGMTPDEIERQEFIDD